MDFRLPLGWAGLLEPGPAAPAGAKVTVLQQAGDVSAEGAQLGGGG